MAEVLDKSKNQEVVLLDKLMRVEEDPAGYLAVHLHLSRLRPVNRKPHFISIAARAFDQLVGNVDAKVYDMMNQDLILVCHNVLVEVIDPYITEIKALFGDDPLTLEEDQYEDRFSTWYDLSADEDFTAFSGIVTELSVIAKNRIERMKRSASGPGEQGTGNPLNARNLTAIDQQLQSTRIANLIRRQACVRIVPGKAGQLVFYEHFIALAELKERIAPGINLFASPWLFQYLTETLDKRMLAVIGRKNFTVLKDPVSLDLNISTVLSRNFANFNKAVGENAHKLVIEFQMIDVFSDMGMYGYARDMLRERGYKVLIDNVNPQALQFFDPVALKPDYIKIGWDKEFDQKTETAPWLETFRKTISLIGRDGVTLSHVDTERAVKSGFKLGVSSFQGYFIDKLTQATGRSGANQGAA